MLVDDVYAVGGVLGRSRSDVVFDVRRSTNDIMYLKGGQV